MKKTILSFILVITAFLGVNLLKVNIYAALAQGEVEPELSYSDKSVVFLGDSITYGSGTTSNKNRYTEIVSEALGFQTMKNYGVSGSLIAQQDGKTNSFIERYSAMTDDADYIFVFGGTNDYWNGTGVFGADSSTTNTEFIGALNNLITGLKTKYPDGEIILITPPKQHFNGVDGTTLNTSSSKNLADYVTEMKKAAVRNGVRYIDLYSVIGFDAMTSTDDRAEFTTDGVHLNNKGHRRVADIIISYMQKRVTTVHTSNMIVNSTITDDFYLNGSNVTALVGSSISDYIEVDPLKWYVMFNEAIEDNTPNSKIISYYDESKTFISQYNGGVETRQTIMIVQAPSTAKYARINITTAKKDIAFMREIVNYDIFTVRFETNGGNEIYRQSILSGEKVTVAAPTKTGYNFVGWYKDASLTELFSIVFDTISEDTTLYAKWTPTSSGGSTIVDNITNFKWSDYLIIVSLLGFGLYLGSKSKKR